MIEQKGLEAGRGGGGGGGGTFVSMYFILHTVINRNNIVS